MFRIVVLLACLWLNPAWAASSYFNVLCYHDVRDDVRDDLDRDVFAVSTDHLIGHFSWLREQGYQPVSIDDLIAAQWGRKKLPDKAILLTFDDGYESFYSRIFPLLKVFNYPAVMALVGSWLEVEPGGSVLYGEELLPRKRFLNWSQMREMRDSGLVEFASHSYDMHKGILANSQGNQRSAASTRMYLKHEQRYETKEEFRRRIKHDLQTNSDLLKRKLGVDIRVMVWPFGEYNQDALTIARAVGMPITLTLNDGYASNDGYTDAQQLTEIPRYLIANNPKLSMLIDDALKPPAPYERLRAIRIDLDRIYHRDPQRQSRNIDALIERVNKLQLNMVFLQAFSSNENVGLADSLYFPNRHLPLKADLFSFIAWQLRTRAGAYVYAWLPMQSFIGSDKNRLSQSQILDIYQDLASYADFTGLLFYDPATIASKSSLIGQQLLDVTDKLFHAARYYRPQLEKALALSEESVSFQTGLRLAQLSSHYDYLLLPELSSAASLRWIDKLISTKTDDYRIGHNNILFELASWEHSRPIPTARLAQTIDDLLHRGVVHIGYYPDDFRHDHPQLESMRQIISANDYPYPLEQ